MFRFRSGPGSTILKRRRRLRRRRGCAGRRGTPAEKSGTGKDAVGLSDSQQGNMELSLTKLPWWRPDRRVLVVSGLAIFGFWKFYVVEMQAEISARQIRVTALQADVERGKATARRLPQFQAEVTELERRLENLRAVLPEEKDVADILRRVQGLATQSNLNIQRFTPQPLKQEELYASLPFRLRAEGTFHDLGFFFDRISKFPRIINVGEISIKTHPKTEAGVTIDAELVATTFILQENKAAGGAGRRAETAGREMSKDTVGMSRARTLACFAAVVPDGLGASAQPPAPPAATPPARRCRRGRRASRCRGAACREACTAAGAGLHVQPGRAPGSVRQPDRQRRRSQVLGGPAERRAGIVDQRNRHQGDPAGGRRVRRDDPGVR